jgi:hypothetical protein
MTSLSRQRDLRRLTLGGVFALTATLDALPFTEEP